MTVLAQHLVVPTESKREMAKAKTRRALLKSALRLYSLEGAQGMSMNKVAKGAGIAQPSFYNHFDSLDALQNELSTQLKDNYLSPMRLAWVDMLKDYDVLSKVQFNERCQQCLVMIFDSAFQNIALFQHLLEDRPRFTANIENQSSLNNGLGNLVTEIQEEWTEIFIQGLQLSNRSCERSAVNLCVDIAAAQVHELILGCHQQRYSRQQAIDTLSSSFDALFANFLHGSNSSE
ncbi:TetR/AcrR family transcriptional regulator [Psychrobacter sp. NZS113]|uniref:TetR/AcrR family transcriptional regulator n=1 Tax=Psychrobacter sp. NZS113 TaxID=2792045 RepID=UPI0018CF2C77|nr:TetR/AcrR family transcriptional regulator [Psychrobacter sp. NZS113]MBH0095050.1 TetR/AcrR family transcriptional regulator [Psychrobacter sp. NZS113]